MNTFGKVQCTFLTVLALVQTALALASIITDGQLWPAVGLEALAVPFYLRLGYIVLYPPEEMRDSE